MTPAVRSILVATDFSGAAEAAGHFARALAGRFGAAMRFLHVVEPAPALIDPMSTGTAVSGSLQAMAEAIGARGEELRRFAERYAPPGAASSCEAPVGAPGAVISEDAAKTGASLVVIGTHGRKGLSRLVFGSVAESVLRHAPCPVVTVRADAAVPENGRPIAPTVLIATHFSPACAAAADWGVAVADRLNARLEFLHVVETDSETFLHDTTRGENNELSEPVTLERYWQMRLEEFVGRHVGGRTGWHARVEPGTPHERILASVSADPPGLLCIGTHRHSAMGQLLGSTAVGLIRDAGCPVLTVRV